MPELPEVETIVRQLQTVLPGKNIQKITVLHAKSFSGQASELEGKTIHLISRKAKTIAISFKRHDSLLLVHLKMTGQCIFVPQRGKRIVGGHPTPDWVEALPSKHTRIGITFSDQSVLYFNDMRVFGWMKVITNDERRAMMEMLPPDVIDPEFTLEYLQKVLSKSSRATKLVILDQARMGGMGNIYANDALWLSGIDPRKPANKLSTSEAKKLHHAMIHVLQRGIELGGASESTYKHINGLGGKYQEEFLIYKKNGEKCSRCGGVIEKFKLGGRGTYWCPGCQS